MIILSEVRFGEPPNTSLVFRTQPSTPRRPDGAEEIQLTQHISGTRRILGRDAKLIPPLVWVPDDELLQPLQLLEESTYEFAVFLPMSYADVQAHRETQGRPLYPFQNDQLLGKISFNEIATQEFEGGCRLFGSLDLKSESGALDLGVDGVDVDMVVDVRTKKLDYRTEFQQLLEGLAEHHGALILNLEGATEALLRSDESRPSTPQTRILHLRRLMRTDAITSALATITNEPAYRFDKTTIVEDIAFSSEVDLGELAANSTSYDWLSGGALQRQFRGFTPATVPERMTIVRHDIPENRFVKAKLQWLQQLMADLDEWLPKNGWHSVRTSLARWMSEVRQFQQRSFFHDVGVDYGTMNSVMMLRRGGYREFFEAMLVFELGLLLDADIGELDNAGTLKRVSDLYELWCFFEMHTILSSFCGEPSESLSHAISENRYHVSLRAGGIGGFSFKWGELDIKLYYVRRFNPPTETDDYWEESYSTVFKPDITIEISSRATSDIRFVFFDAKYKLDSKTWSDQFKEVSKDDAVYKRADLHVMHCYRDAVLNSVGSYVLYPGTTNSDVFVCAQTKAEREGQVVPSIGAFPLKPSPTQLENQRAAITLFLRSILASTALTLS